MFSISNLVGTPKLGGSKLEFTPIGKRRNQNEQLRPSPRMALNTEKVTNATFDSTYDDSSDHNDTLQSLIPEEETQGTHFQRGTLLRSRERIVSDGSSSIKDLQRENKDLQAENYSLKIEVATLTKFLKQTPEESRDMAYENVELKQQLARLLQREKNGLADSHDQSAAFESLKTLYKEALADHEAEKRNLERQITELQQEVEESRHLAASRSPLVPNEILERLEFLQSENQSLRRRLEDASSHDLDYSSLQHENNELKTELHKLQMRLTQIPEDAPGRLESLSENNSTLERKLESAKRDLDQVERERDNLETNLRAARLELQNSDAEIERLRLQCDEYKSRFSDSRNESNKVEEARREVNDLRAKLVRLEAQKTLDLESKDSEISRLQRKLDALQKELKEKDKDEYNLRSQVRSLMEERNFAFGLESTVKHYQEQLETLRAKEESLSRKNRELKEEIAKLQDDLYSVNTDASRMNKMREELGQLQDKLEFYEQEYTLLQDAIESAESELDSYREKERRAEDRDTELLKEIEELRARLKRAELMESQKYNESALYELDSVHKKREESERRRLETQIEALKLQIRSLERELETAKTKGNSVLDADYHRLLSERSKLQMDLDEKELKIREQERRYSKLENLAKDKDAVVEALETRIRELNREYNSSMLNETSKSEILKMKSDYEYQIRTLRLDSERLQKDLEDQIRFYKTKLDVMMDRERFANQQPNGSSAIVTLLESQLEESRNLNRDLTEKLSAMERVSQDIPRRTEEEHRAKIQNLESKLAKTQEEYLVKLNDLETKLLKAQEERIRLEESRKLNKELSERIDAMERAKEQNIDRYNEDHRGKIKELNLKLAKTQEEKMTLEETVDSLETDIRLLQSEKMRLETRSANLSQELSKTSRHCAKLASKINEMDLQEYKNSYRNVDEAFKSKKMNAQLQHEVDILNNKLASATLGDSGNESVETRLLRNEVQYFKAKLYDLNMRANDLALMNSFVMSSIKNSNQMIKNDIVKLAQCGVYPDYSEMGRRHGGKLTLKKLALFVLSMVRLQRRSAKAEQRRIKLMLLRGDIDRDRITLLAE